MTGPDDVFIASEFLDLLFWGVFEFRSKVAYRSLVVARGDDADSPVALPSPRWGFFVLRDDGNDVGWVVCQGVYWANVSLGPFDPSPLLGESHRFDEFGVARYDA